MRRLALSFVCAAFAFVLSTSSAVAGQVTVEGVHLCCGACVKAVNGLFANAEGISNVAVDKDAGTVKFDAGDAKTARTGVQALAKAGFAGTAKFDGKELKFPKGFKEDGKASEVTVGGLHNCCPGCTKAIEGALKGVSGVQSVKCEKRKCMLTGSDISYSAVIAALHGAGLHGNIATPKAE